MRPSDVPGTRVAHAGQRPREYQLPTVRELYPPWHPQAGHQIDTSSFGAGAPRLHRPVSRGAAASRA